MCACGATTVVRENNLVTGHTKSCGHLVVSGDNQIHKSSNLRHGETRGKMRPVEWRAWCAIRDRCRNPNHRNFPGYGGRGITVCDRWASSYENFLADVGRRPGPGYSIDRINNNRGYEPGNVRWATRLQQARNKRGTHYASFAGVRLTVSEWAELAGMRGEVLRARVVRYGWDMELALSEPVRMRRTACASAAST